jgi:hypothetical protein
MDDGFHKRAHDPGQAAHNRRGGVRGEHRHEGEDTPRQARMPEQGATMDWRPDVGRERVGWLVVFGEGGGDVGDMGGERWLGKMNMRRGWPGGWDPHAGGGGAPTRMR